MRISFSSIALAIVALACLQGPAPSAQAAGLGRLTVLSALGQPLSAEVEIISLQPGEEDGLSARLAPLDAFRQAGIEFNPALLSIRFAVEQRSGRPTLRITSSQAINEPFLDLLVELQWNTGRLVREYTFLLDPPAFRPSAPAVADPTPPAAPPAIVGTAPAAPAAVGPARAPASPAAAAPREPRAAVTPAPAASGTTYQVKRGDTLAGIARENAIQGATFNQMLVALFRANADAFDGGNMNRLREGRILNLPERDAAMAIDPDEARRVLQAQSVDFAQYKRSLAGAVALAKGESAGGQRSASGAITTPASAPSGAAPKDELKLSKADTGKPSSAASRAASGDQAASSARAAREAQSRVDDLEKTVADLRKLLELKDKQMAELQAKAGAKPAPEAPAKPAPAAPEAPSAAVPAKPEVAPTPAPPAQDAAPAAAASAPAPAAGEATGPAAQAGTPPAPPPPKPAAKAKPAPAAPPPPPPSMLDEFLDNPIALFGFPLVILALIGYGWWAWRRKKRAARATFQDGMVSPTFAAGGGAAAAAAAPLAAEPAVAPAAAPVAIAPESDEVDPVAEADVYMAYGRDAQAEEILSEALQKDPGRVAVLAKLIEIYAHRRDPKALEQAALKLKSATGGAGADWDKAAALGRSIDPQNALYGGAGGAAEVPAAAAASPAALDFDLDAFAAAPSAGAVAPAASDVTLDFDLGAPGEVPSETSPPQPASAEADKPADLSSGLDFDLGASEVKAEPEAPAPGAALADGGLDFDLGLGDAKAEEEEEKPAPEAPAAVPPQASAPDDGSINFDIDLDLGHAPSADPSAKAEAPAIDLSSISLDLDVPGQAPGPGLPDPRWQEVATKLDLARAYEEMGDKSGARDLLNEVMKDGDSAQQGQAQEILGRLG